MALKIFPKPQQLEIKSWNIKPMKDKLIQTTIESIRSMISRPPCIHHFSLSMIIYPNKGNLKGEFYFDIQFLKDIFYYGMKIMVTSSRSHDGKRKLVVTLHSKSESREWAEIRAGPQGCHLQLTSSSKVPTSKAGTTSKTVLHAGDQVLKPMILWNISQIKLYHSQ